MLKLASISREMLANNKHKRKDKKMTTQKVIQQFLAHESAHTPIRNLMWGGRNCSISTDGTRLWSYNTIIAQWGGDTVLINNTKYSNTTSKQQGMLRRECEKLNIKTEEM